MSNIHFAFVFRTNSCSKSSISKGQVSSTGQNSSSTTGQSSPKKTLVKTRPPKKTLTQTHFQFLAKNWEHVCANVYFFGWATTWSLGSTYIRKGFWKVCLITWYVEEEVTPSKALPMCHSGSCFKVCCQVHPSIPILCQGFPLPAKFQFNPCLSPLIHTLLFWA